MRRSTFSRAGAPRLTTDATRPINLERRVDRALVWLLRLAPGSLDQWYETTNGRKKVRYAVVSMVAVPIGTAAVAVFNLVGVTAGLSALLGSSVGAAPSYSLNRYWVWGKTDKNRIMAEILPFWTITLVGIGFSFFVGHDAGQFTNHHDITGLTRLVILLVANVTGFGLLWVAKYLLFNKALFVVRREATSGTVPTTAEQVT